MDEYEGLSHSKWECKYHALFIPSVAARRCMEASACGLNATTAAAAAPDASTDRTKVKHEERNAPGYSDG
jgi:hypothetical protein